MTLLLYVFSSSLREGWMLGYESMLLHGFPKEVLDEERLAQHGIKDQTLQDLAGNAFSCPVIALILISLFVVIGRHSLHERLSGEEMPSSSSRNPPDVAQAPAPSGSSPTAHDSASGVAQPDMAGFDDLADLMAEL